MKLQAETSFMPKVQFTGFKKKGTVKNVEHRQGKFSYSYLTHTYLTRSEQIKDLSLYLKVDLCICKLKTSISVSVVN